MNFKNKIATFLHFYKHISTLKVSKFQSSIQATNVTFILLIILLIFIKLVSIYFIHIFFFVSTTIIQKVKWNIRLAPPAQTIPFNPSSSSTSKLRKISLSPTRLFELHWLRGFPGDAVCRFKNACLFKNGTVLVRERIQKYNNHVKFCGRPDVVFKPSREIKHLNISYSKENMFGTRPVRWHIPHFAQDVLTYIFAFFVIHGRKECRIHEYSRSHSTRNCTGDLSAAYARSAFLVDDRVEAFDDSTWVKKFMATLPGNPYGIYTTNVFHKSEARCFKSVITYTKGNIVKPFKYISFDSKKLVFRNFMRHNDLADRGDIKKLEGNRNINILVINRPGWKEQGDFLVGRDIVNIDAVRRQINNAIGELGDLTITFEEKFFNSLQFEDQIRVIRKADLVIGVHGAGLTNILFSKESVPVIEILPFAYYAGPFDSICKARYLTYNYLVANPDSENFIECIQRRALRIKDQSLVAAAKQFWSSSINNFNNSRLGTEYNAIRFRDKNLANIKMCARSQRFHVNEKEVARIVVQQIRYVRELTRFKNLYVPQSM